jgi:hypothetical protein
LGDLCGVSHHDDRAAERAFRLNALAIWAFSRGHAVDGILLILLTEAVWLTRWRGWGIGATALRLLPGAFMLLALRAALTGMAWPWIALALAASFPFHVADIRRRGG